MTVTVLLSRPQRDVWQRIGDWLARYQRQVRWLQWSVVSVYAVLLVVPAFLPMPGNAAHIWDDFTRFAQFAFWGIWWPMVLLATALVGRVWCGLLCPEGAISEFSSRHGRGGGIPRWVKWNGWPTVAFAGTTLYGQMVSVYQYPKPALLVLGGSTLAAAVVGYLYGKEKRVWCRYLCPVGGVFGLLAKLAPLHFRVDAEIWRETQRAGLKPGAVNCAPLVPLKTMRGASDCHMCGRCSGFRGAIRLARRSPLHEIVHVAGKHPNPWETVLIVFGLMGVAFGAFHWSVSPWFNAAKQWVAEWLVECGVLWPLEVSPPWWVLTNYPERNDVLSLLDGAILVLYVLTTALAVGLAITLLLSLATLCLGRWNAARFHHLAQTLIPLAAAGVFLGLSALSVTQLRMDGIDLPWVDEARGAMLFLASGWSGVLCWRVTGLYCKPPGRRMMALASIGLAVAIATSGWFLFFWGW
ncbi:MULTISPECIES: 4Fe-4S binding protein [unclassified Sinorhizobium]|uniref:4Fe-4S binding protein n=1 Tax=unclassified Sinorhizobium TaxID=2613772 RepID=UPI0024C37BE5|nr:MULTISPECIES: 4Fe-4S binding protein [unclassified Sinorhizobium]MDK1374569.1 4Fe-4S binding protein [Sinorhizobium sp. 6-70]MDK1478231.1 4Fe-4S binding protein [Sinorhizobium sp. 6-117]